MSSIIDVLDAPPTPGRGLLIVPKWDAGDDRIEWDAKKPESIAAARKHFVELKAKGYKAFRVDPKSAEKGAPLTEFDEKAEKIVMVPAFAGG